MLTRSTSKYLDLELIPAKITFLFWGGLIGTFILYLNPFLEHLGLPKDRVGIITGIGFAIGALAGPAWGMVIDYTKSPKIVLTIICIFATISISTMPFIAAAIPIDSEACINASTLHERLGSFNTTTRNGTFTNLTDLSTELNYTSYLKADCSATHKVNEDRIFYVFLAVMGFGSIFYMNIQTLTDSTIWKCTKVINAKATYGTQRLFGSVGGTASVYLTAAIIDRVEIKGLSKYSAAFFVYVPFALPCVILCCYLIKKSEKKMQVMQDEWTTDHLKGLHDNNDCSIKALEDDDDISITTHLKQMLSQVEVIVMMITAFIGGSSLNLFIFFTYFLIEEQLSDVSEFQVGFIFSGKYAYTILMFAFTGKIIKLLGGPKLAIVIGVFAHCIRNIIMSYTNTYYVMLGVQLLHTLNLSLFISALMEYMHMISPKKIVTTMIMIMQSLHYAFSPFVVNMVGGIVCKDYSAQWLFRVAGFICGVWGVVLVVYFGATYLLSKKDESFSSESKNEDLAENFNMKSDNKDKMLC